MHILEERIEFRLKRAFEIVDQEKNQGRKGQTAMASEMLRGGFVAIQEGIRKNNFLEVSKQVGTLFSNMCNLHAKRVGGLFSNHDWAFLLW